LDLGSNIDLTTLNLATMNNSATLIIYVGTSARVTQAQSLFLVGFSIDATTIFSF
jgi:hypothetical protein